MGEIRSKRCEGRQLTKDQLVDELVRHPLLHPLVDSLDADYAAAGNLPAGRTEPTQPTPVTSQERGGGWVRGSVDFVPIAGGTDDPSPEAAGTEPPPTPPSSKRRTNSTKDIAEILNSQPISAPPRLASCAASARIRGI
eukprot:COSAG04_NODE_2697_length_3716_cov_5.217307_3_plen_138_part_01